MSFKYGVGVLKKPTPEIKAFTLRYEMPLLYPCLAIEGGLWSDKGPKEEGRKGSGLLALQLGVKPESDHFYVKAFWGVAALSATDTQLGGHSQFMMDLGLGFQDELRFVGIGIKHISSAGIWKPNHGRDFIMAELGVYF